MKKFSLILLTGIILATTFAPTAGAWMIFQYRDVEYRPNQERITERVKTNCELRKQVVKELRPVKAKNLKKRIERIKRLRSIK